MPAPKEDVDAIFISVEEIAAFIELVGEDEQYQAQCQVLEGIIKSHDEASSLVEEVFEYIKDSGAYKRHITEDEFVQAWKGVQEVVILNKARRNRKQEAINAALKYWVDDNTAREWLLAADASASTTFLAAVQRVAKKMPFRSAVQKVNRAVINRLRTPRRGLSNARHYITGDWNIALTIPDELHAMDEFELRRYSLSADEFGFVVEGVDAGDLESTLVSAPAGELAQGDFTPRRGEIQTPRPPASPPPAAAAEALARVSEAPATERQQFAGPISQGGPELVEDGEGSAGTEDLSDRESSCSSDEDPATSKVGEPRAEKGELTSSGSEELSNSKSEESLAPCKCSADVTQLWQRKVSSTKSIAVSNSLALLEEWAGFGSVCYAHCRAVAGRAGLVVNGLNHRDLMQRILSVHEARLTIGKLKTDPETYRWFRRSHRPQRPSDSLGPYKHRPTSPAPFSYDQEALLRSFDDDGVSERWKRDGTVNTDVFSWWFKTAIGDIVLSEFDMYRHHLRDINGRSNWGWLRNMFHSIGQQLMREDPVYYMLYAALRPDRHWRLISYPYYAKYAQKGDSTFFRHIDLNLPDLLSNGRGSAQIQGTVSLDDETDDNCTELLPGMHRRLGEWWELCVKRGAKSDTFVHRITEHMYTNRDASKFGIKWTSVPCRRGEARVTLPHIPHGSHGPATGTRRTMLPWFVGLQDDLSTLEVTEAGTWAQLRDAHMSLSAGHASPSGLANRYGAILFRFPASVEIESMGALSDALVCRLPWDSPRVERDRDVILGPDREAAREYISAWRQRATAAAVETMQLVRRREMEAFGDRSYFYHLDRLHLHGIPIPLLPDDEDGDGELDGARDGGSGSQHGHEP